MLSRRNLLRLASLLPLSVLPPIDTPESPGPAVFDTVLDINGWWWTIRFWTPEQWADEANRPSDPFPMSGGGWMHMGPYAGGQK